MTIRPRRSCLYMPAPNARAIEKARSLPCDVVILDLEDAVAPDAKETARAQAVEAVRAGGFGRREVVIRVNGLDTPWGEADLKAAAEAGPDAVLVPKVGDGADIARYGGRLSHAPEKTRLWAMIETARSLFHLPGVAAAAKTSRLSALVLGPNDLAKECGLAHDGGARALLRRLLPHHRRRQGARAHGAGRPLRRTGERGGAGARVRPRPRLRLRRQDPDPSRPDRDRQSPLRPERGRSRRGPRHHRRLRGARKRRQGRPPRERQDGGAATLGGGGKGWWRWRKPSLPTD